MLVCINLKDAPTYRSAGFDIIDITRTSTCENATAMPQLAPTPELYHATLLCMDKKLWTWERWMSWYVPQYINHIKWFGPAQDALELLALTYGQSKTRNAAFGCWCKNEMMCHRSIVAGILNGKGATVVTKTGQDYKLYHHMLYGGDVNNATDT